jgi:hypothetical protein
MTAASLPWSRFTCLAAAADIRLIQHIIVHQRGHVDHLADGRERDVGRRSRLELIGPCGQAAGEHKRRPEHLAAIRFDVAHQPRNRREIGSELTVEALVDALKARCDRGLHGGKVCGNVEEAGHSVQA